MHSMIPCGSCRCRCRIDRWFLRRRSLDASDRPGPTGPASSRARERLERLIVGQARSHPIRGSTRSETEQAAERSPAGAPSLLRHGCQLSAGGVARRAGLRFRWSGRAR
jgi:hypothetical protein